MARSMPNLDGRGLIFPLAGVVVLIATVAGAEDFHRAYGGA